MVKVPTHTTVNSDEPIFERYTIPLAPELTSFILTGEKLTTYRFGRKYDYISPGDVVNIQDSTTGNKVARAKITSKEYSKFSDLPISIPGHESYENKEHQRQVFSGYYAYLGRPITDDDEFLELSFELTK